MKQPEEKYNPVTKREWVKKRLVYKRSKQTAPFCPDCGEELDDLQMTNEIDGCKCGDWSIKFGSPPSEGGTFFKPYIKKI